MISPVEFAVLFVSGGGFFLAGALTEKANARRTYHDLNVAIPESEDEKGNLSFPQNSEDEANVSRHISRAVEGVL